MEIIEANRQLVIKENIIVMLSGVRGVRTPSRENT